MRAPRWVVLATFCAVLAVLSFEAVAIWPTIIIGGARLVTGAVGAARVYSLAEAAVALGGELANYLQVTDAAGTAIMNIPVSSAYQPPVPSGWTPASPATGAPIPPSPVAGQPTTMYGYGQLGIHNQPSVAAVGEAYKQYLIANNSVYCGQSGGQALYAALTVENVSGLSFGLFADCSPLGGSGHTTYTAQNEGTTYTCPPGYGASGSTCVIQAAAQVWLPPDTLCGVINASGSYSLDPRDPDCYGSDHSADTSAAPPGTVPASTLRPTTISADGKTITVTGPDSQVRVTINADGSSTVTTWTPSTSNPNNTVIREVGVNNNSTVTNNTTSTVNTTGPSSFTNNVAISNTATTSGTGQALTFPTDYARDATVQTSNTKLQQLHTDLTDMSASAPSDPTVRTTSEIGGLLMDGTFSTLKAWGMPTRSVSCPTASFSIWSHAFTIDAHCTLWATISSTVQAVMLLIWGLMALFLVLGA